MNFYKIYFDTCENLLEKKIKDISLMVTSPPYWDLKDYEAENQIGYKETYDEYMRRMKIVWDNCYKVMAKNSVAIININTKSFKSNLKLIPYDFIKQMTSIGFEFVDMLYWHKSSAIPSLNNLKDHFEYFIIFTKGKYEIDNQFKYLDYKIDSKTNKPNIWNINKKFGSVGKKFMVHPAIFPIEFITRIVKIFSKENDTVLDPFLGSGTTLISSYKSKRSFVGFELNNSEYKKLIIENLKDNQVDLNTIDFLN